MSAEVGKDATQKIKELVRMLFLDIGKLLSSCVPNKLSASFLQETKAEVSSPTKMTKRRKVRSRDQTIQPDRD